MLTLQVHTHTLKTKEEFQIKYKLGNAVELLEHSWSSYVSGDSRFAKDTVTHGNVGNAGSFYQDQLL